MPPETFSPSRAAKQVGIPPNTLRAWCRTYGEFLSAQANPPTGEERQLTAGDIEVLRAVAALRANDLPIEAIQQRLRENLPEALQTPLQAPETPVTASPGTSLAPTAPNTPEAFLAVATQQLSDVARKVETVDDRIAQVDQRLQRVEASRNLVLVAAVAFAAGAVVVAVIAWLVASWAR